MKHLVTIFSLAMLLLPASVLAETKSDLFPSNCRIGRLMQIAGPGVVSIRQAYRCGNRKLVVYDPAKTSIRKILKRVSDANCLPGRRTTPATRC
jgi:hypothetical protein